MRRFYLQKEFRLRQENMTEPSPTKGEKSSQRPHFRSFQLYYLKK